MRHWRKIVLVGLIGFNAFLVYYNLKYFEQYKPDIIIGASNTLNKIALPFRIAELYSLSPDDSIKIPINDLLISDIEDTFGAPRGEDRIHEGIDIFAEVNEPIYSATSGYLIKKKEGGLGGKNVTIIGAGGRTYYYAHLNSFAPLIKVGSYINKGDLLGYVGNTGNASTTPYHLHFGVYDKFKAINPYILFEPEF